MSGFRSADYALAVKPSASLPNGSHGREQKGVLGESTTADERIRIAPRHRDGSPDRPYGPRPSRRSRSAGPMRGCFDSGSPSGTHPSAFRPTSSASTRRPSGSKALALPNLVWEVTGAPRPWTAIAASDTTTSSLRRIPALLRRNLETKGLRRAVITFPDGSPSAPGAADAEAPCRPRSGLARRPGPTPAPLSLFEGRGRSRMP